MRVIAGEARGHTLRAPKGVATRPTADKIKGAIFSMIESAFLRIGREEGWEGCRVLDLFAGTGALGIEALSRGAEHADFVERVSTVCTFAEDNLRRTGLADRGSVHRLTVAAALERADVLPGPYDVILIDAPYLDPGLHDVVETVMSGRLVFAKSLVVVEHAKRVTLAEEYGKLRRFRLRVHGDTAVSVFGPNAFDDERTD